MPKTTEVATASEEMPAKPEEFQAAYDAILEGAPIPYDRDPAIVTREIAERILKAESFEEAFQPQELDSWNELEGVPVKVRSFHLNPSQFEGAEGPSCYAVVELERLDDGSTARVTNGSVNVMLQLVKSLEMGWIGKPVKLVSKPTREGRAAHWLVPA